MNRHRITTHLVAVLLLLFAFAAASITPAKAIAAEPKQTTLKDLALFQTAVELTQTGRWKEAETIFGEIAKRNPSWPEPRNNQAVALYNTGKLEQAQEALEQAVSSLPSFKVAHANRQRLYDYSATRAYYKAVGINEKPEPPKLEILDEVKGSSSIVTRLAPAKPASPAAAADVADAVSKIRTSLLLWAEAWSTSNIDGYLAAYSEQFRPEDSNWDYATWLQKRRDKLRFTRIDRVSLDNIQVYLAPGGQRAVAEFEQHYQSPTYQDRVVKQLKLVAEGSLWLIQSERVVRQIN